MALPLQQGCSTTAPEQGAWGLGVSPEKPGRLQGTVPNHWIQHEPKTGVALPPSAQLEQHLHPEHRLHNKIFVRDGLLFSTLQQYTWMHVTFVHRSVYAAQREQAFAAVDFLLKVCHVTPPISKHCACNKKYRCPSQHNNLMQKMPGKQQTQHDSISSQQP